MSENFKPGLGGLGGIEAGIPGQELAEDISLYRSTDSLDSLSSGDSDGGPAEPTLAEISMLSASIDARNVEAAKDEVDMASEVNEVVEVTPVFPAGFHRLPSAMRPPVRRGHVRSASAGGNVLNFRGGQLQSNVSKPARAAVTNTASLSTTSGAATSASAASTTITANTKVAAVQNQHRQHRRVFSHGHITFGVPGSDSEIMPPKSGGHRRTGSRTDFILPPDHEERERKRSSLQRQDSAPTSASNRQRQGSGFHRRHDSLAFSFRGHSRQASRSDSIYTLRHPKGTWTLKDKLCSFWTRWKNEDLHKERQVRTIVPNHTIPSDVPRDKHPNCKFANNNISTTKYSWLSFLPKNLFEQFHRFANLYFLFIVILNWVPSISAFGREISMLPLIFVLGVTALKDIFEDRRRYLSDTRVNNYTCRVYKNSVGRYIKTLWKDVKVGDMVHLSVNEMIPADIVVLRSSDEHGLCYIDTQNLDGETNLKQREVPRGFVDRQQNFQPQDFRSSLECDLPTTKIYRFNGTIMHPTGGKVPVGKDNLLLRECVLKNTDFIEGMVVYAGKESKAMLNNDGPRYKRSKLEMQMNRDVIWCVFLLLVMCLMGAIGTAVWLGKFTEYVPFLNTLTFEETQPFWEGFLVFWTFVILLQVIIPMSLYVTIEMTKLCQIYLMHQDIRMWDESCGKGLECRALNIPEELGQIQYVFCDKTGTLTENNMVFKRCTIGGQDFAHKPITMQPKFSGSSLASLNHLPANGLQAATPTGKPIIPVNPTLNDRLVSAADIQFLIEGKETKLRMHPQAGITQDFFLLMAVCNTVIVAKHPHKDMMNASGMICNTSAIDKSEHQTNADSVSNCETESIATTVTAVSAPLQPEPTLTPKRSTRFFFTNPLSPIASSPETSPPASPAINRPKHLQLPSLWSKVMGRDGSSSKLNHSSRSPTPTPSEIRPIYEAESPDELALVDAAFAYNCKLIKRSPQSAVVSLPGEGLIEFEVLHVLPFDSDRKRMSIILRHPLTRERILFCKGADSAIFSRLEAPEVGSEEEALLEKTQQHLNMYAKEGLRVLVMAKRILSEHEYEEWLILHEKAENSLRMREKLLMESYKRIESNLKLLGATGIEDKLQEGVPNAIENLRQAGIVVWVLTGDKQETAINIAYSCKLFTHAMDIIKLNATSRDATEQMIKKHLEQIRDEQDALTESCHFQGKYWTKSDFIAHKKRNRAIVVDGRTLVYILDSRANLQHPFLELTEECAAVLGCRATPLQKAFLVGIVKEKLGMHTLAIGDGANDVSMIQTADVGIGISGMEGMQAVMASDFAITKFKYLERLVLVHGHWNYDRLARMVLYFFYKNAAFVFVTFWFQLYAGFSGAIMFDHMYLMLYNLLWTSLPPVAIGVLDQMAPDHVLESKPHLYIRGRKSRVYKPYSFWLNMLDAFYQSLIIFFISFGAYNDMDVGLWECGTTVITASLFVMCLHLAIETKSWTIIHWTSMLLSILFFFAFVLIYNSFCITCFGLQNPFWVIQHSMGSAEYWLIILLTSITALLPRITYRALKNTLKPDPITKEMLSRNRSIHSSSSGTVKSGSRSSAHSTNLSWSRTGSSHASSLRKYSKEETETEMTAIVP